MLSIFPLEIRSLILLALSYGLAFILLKPIFKDRILIKWIFLSILINITVSFGSILFLALIVLCISIYISKQEPVIILSYYIVLLCALPATVGYNFSYIWGITHLGIIKYPMLLSLFLLFPLLLRKRASKTDILVPTKPHTDKKINNIFLIWVLFLILMTFREESLTSAIRESFYIFIEVALPFFAFSRFVRCRDDFTKITSAILVSITILSVVTLIEVLMSWSFVRNHIPRELMLSDFFYRVGSRGGGVRLGSTVGEPLGYAYLLLMWLVAFSFVRLNVFKKNNVLFLILTTLIILSIAATGSRAVLLMLIPILALIFYYKKKSKGRAKFIGFVFIVAGLISISLLPTLISYDQYGTFQYRVDLLKESWVVIKSNIFIGSTDYRTHLESLRQGQGIIDIVNSYIGVALKYGFVGLGLFVMLFIGPIKTMNRMQLKLSSKDRNIALWLICSLVITMLYIFTTSSISIIAYYYWSLLGTSIAFIRYCRVNNEH